MADPSQPEAMEEECAPENIMELSNVDRLKIQLGELQKRLDMEEERHTCNFLFNQFKKQNIYWWIVFVLNQLIENVVVVIV